MSVACPQGYEPNAQVLAKAREMGGRINVITDPIKAAKNADILSTDVWVSMGDEEEYDQRLCDFKPYQINSKLLEQAKHDVMVLHCLPAHRGEEVSEEVLEGWRSIVWEQAQNRQYVQEAILEFLLRV